MTTDGQPYPAVTILPRLAAATESIRIHLHIGVIAS
jgi:hypothetical protein